jgi:hypothetical protein
MKDQVTDKLQLNLNRFALEADLAYFGARIELVGKPETYYQLAQLKVYQSLERSLEETLRRLRKND